jgi:hypothetical protein
MKSFREMSREAFHAVVNEPTGVSLSELKLLCNEAREKSRKEAQLSGGAYYAGWDDALDAVIKAIDGNLEVLKDPFKS